MKLQRSCTTEVTEKNSGQVSSKKEEKIQTMSKSQTAAKMYCMGGKTGQRQECRLLTPEMAAELKGGGGKKRNEGEVGSPNETKRIAGE